MSLKNVDLIEVPGSADTLFDHGAFEPGSRRVFVAHTARDRIEVLDHDTSQHFATLKGFPGAAGVVADEGQVLITNRGAASLAWVDARSLQTRAVYDTGPRPNGVALVPHRRLALVACIGDEDHGPELQMVDLDRGRRRAIQLPGRPRWCVTDRAGTRLFVAIREPSSVLVVQLPELDHMQQWPLPSNGAHGIDIDHHRNRLYVACDGGALVELDAMAGDICGEWPLAGVPDATFFNPTSGLVHVAISDPGLVESIDPRAGTIVQFTTGIGAQTTALVPPDRLYVFSPSHRGALVLEGA